MPDNDNKEMDLLMGVGPGFDFSNEVKKTLRVGTIKEIREIDELYKDKLKRPRFAFRSENAEEEINKWVEILDIICIEGFSREEFENSVPENMEIAVERFLFGQ